VGAKGEILFRMMEHDMNGHHHNVYMLKRNAGGRGIHEIQHIRSFMLDQGESHASERSDGESGNPNDAAGNERASVPNGDGEPAEPETCPYKVKDITDSAGQHSRTAKTEGDAVDESKDEGKLALGKKPEKLEEMPTKTSEQSAENTRVNPVESRTAMKSQYGLKRLSTTPEDSICAGATVSSKDPSSPLSILKQQTAYGGTSLAPKDSFMEVTTTEVPGGQGGPKSRELDLVVYSFNGPQLHNHHDDHAKHYGSQAHAEAHAMEILDMAISSHEKFEHGESDKLIRACRTDQVREALFSYLSNPENNREHRHNAAIKVLGACSFVINQHQVCVRACACVRVCVCWVTEHLCMLTGTCLLPGKGRKEHPEAGGGERHAGDRSRSEYPRSYCARLPLHRHTAFDGRHHQRRIRHPCRRDCDARDGSAPQEPSNLQQENRSSGPPYDHVRRYVQHPAQKRHEKGRYGPR
jgi:hypothetical protein